MSDATNNNNSELRKELEAAKAEIRQLRSTVADLEALFDAGRRRVIIIDTKGIILAANQELAVSYGATPEEMCGKSIKSYLPLPLYESRMEKIRQVVTTRKPLQYQDCREGFHFVHFLHPVIENGEVVRIVGSIEEISAELSKDKELEKAGRIHSILFEIVQLGIIHKELLGMLRGVHRILDRELDMPNLFVALINEEADTLEFRYCEDETLNYCPTVENISSLGARRLSLLPIRRNEMVLLDRAELARLDAGNEVEIHGVLPEMWLGIPLTVHGTPIGVMVFQDYARQREFTDVDIQLIRACAYQLARGIEQKRYEDLSRFTRDIYQNIPSALFIYQYGPPDTLTLLDANAAAESLTGILLKGNKGKEFFDLWPDTRGSAIKQQLLEPIFTGKDFITEELQYDGEELVHASRVHSFSLPGNKLGISIEDITEDKRGEMDIRRSVEYYRAFFEDNHTVMIIIDPKTGRILDSNNAAQQYYGYPREELLQMNIKNISMLAPSVVSRLLNNVSDKRVRRFQARHRLADGEVRDVEVFSGPFKFSGSPRLISIIHDITDRLKAEKVLSEAKEVAVQANQAKDEFLANISHEIRTPLNGVMGMLQLIQETNMDEDRAKLVETALQSSKNLLRVLNDLLDFSKMEAGKLEIYNETFGLKTLVSECVSLFRQQADAAGIQLDWTIQEGTGDYFRGDEGRLRQVLFNLLGNAIKFTENGHVHLDVYATPLPSGKDVRLFFAVEDTGVGIPPDKIDYIFESFSQVDGSLTRKYQGTGLGLPIVKRLVKLMDGHIDVDSEDGKGTCILVNVRVRRAAPPDETDHPAPSKHFYPIRILLAEDEQVNRLMAKRLLEQMGHTVHCAENGAACLDALGRESFDLILMDIQMPVLNGLEATQTIRNDSKFHDIRDIPIVALTAHAGKGDMQTALDAGMDNYITKPFEIKELKSTIASLTAPPAPPKDKS